jgi:hypothetical protein
MVVVMSTHAPGPWAIIPQRSPEGDIATVYGTTDGWVSIHAPAWTNIGSGEVAMANARLIAAAPDLLEALHEVYRQLMNLQPIIGNGLLNDRQLASIDPRIDMCIEAANCAIAKATGGEA